MNINEIINNLKAISKHLEELHPDNYWTSGAKEIENAVIELERNKEELSNVEIMPTDTSKNNFILKANNGDCYYRVREGTGDNLDTEDIELGYVDYIYFDIYDTCEDAVNEENEIDGGMVLLKTLYKDMTLEQIVEKVVEFESIKDYKIIGKVEEE